MNRSERTSELIANGGVTGAFTCERDCVDRAFRQHRATIRGYLEASVPILFLCETHLDRLDAKRRLAELAPAGFTVR